MHVLLVEDDATALRAMRDYFLATGRDVSCASTLADAVTQLDREQFELVITDLQLGPGPDRSGLEVVSAVRAREPRTPVIMITAHGSGEVEQEARERGADRVLAKPISLHVLSRLAVELARDDDAAGSGGLPS